MKNTLVKVRFIHVPLTELTFKSVMDALANNHPEHSEELTQLFSSAFGGENFLDLSPVPLWGWIGKDNTILNSFPAEVKTTIKDVLKALNYGDTVDISAELTTHISAKSPKESRDQVLKIIDNAAQPNEYLSIYDYGIGIHQPDHHASILVYYACNAKSELQKAHTQKFLNSFYQEVLIELGRNTNLKF